MIQKIWSYLVGYVMVKVEGNNIERFINMCMKRGILLWDMRRLDQQNISVKVRLGGFWSLRHICKKVSCKLKVKGKNGLPFYISVLKKRKMLVAGGAFFSIVLYLLSSFLWTVDVQGNKIVPKDKVILAAKRAGLANGTPKWDIEVKEIEENILNSMPEFEWVGVKIRGTKAIINVVERKVPRVVDNRPANIIAAKSGLIYEIIVLEGEAKVMEGDLVRRGQILITGEMVNEVQQPEQKDNLIAETELKNKPQTIKEYRYVHGQGMVKARVWYNEYGESEIIQSGIRDTGRKARIIYIHIGGREVILKGPRGIPFSKYRKVVYVKRIPNWRNISIPVEVISTDFYETENFQINHGPEKAKKMAINKAMEIARKKLPKEYKINKQEISLIKTLDDNLIRVKILIETIEDIGSIQHIKFMKK